MAVAAVHTAVLLGSTIATAGLGMAVVGLVSSALTLADVIHGWHKKNQGFSVAPFMDFLEFKLEPKCYAAISVLSAAKAREYQWKTTKNIDVVTLKVLRYFDPDVTLQSEEEGVAAKLKVLKRVLKKRNRCTGADGECVDTGELRDPILVLVQWEHTPLQPERSEGDLVPPWQG